MILLFGVFPHLFFFFFSPAFQYINTSEFLIHILPIQLSVHTLNNYIKAISESLLSKFHSVNWFIYELCYFSRIILSETTVQDMAMLLLLLYFLFHT